MAYPYQIFDVFSDAPLAGNPLAVVFEADDLSDADMLRIAGEFNLSETVFVLRPQDDGADARIRIFTPTAELPFAGHPTVGTIVAFGLSEGGGAREVRLALNAGPVLGTYEPGTTGGSAAFDAPLVPRLGEACPIEPIAEALGISAGDIGFDGLVPVEATSGPSFTVVPLAAPEVLGRLTRDRRLWKQAFAAPPHAAFCVAPSDAGTYRARMFAPFAGIEEDPATGSAAVAFAALLAPGLPGDGEHAFTIVQGVEMGRRSVMRLSMALDGGVLRRVRLAGDAVKIAEGRLLV